MRGLRFVVLIREDLKVEPVVDEIAKPALSPPGFSTRGRNFQPAISRKKARYSTNWASINRVAQYGK